MMPLVHQTVKNQLPSHHRMAGGRWHAQIVGKFNRSPAVMPDRKWRKARHLGRQSNMTIWSISSGFVQRERTAFCNGYCGCYCGLRSEERKRTRSLTRRVSPLKLCAKEGSGELSA